MTTWIKYTPSGNDYIPIDLWGKDHWSTLAYLETVTVDRNGIVGNAQMRCNPRLHREFAYVSGFENTINDGSNYPTRLKGGHRVNHHDDWSCLEDAVAAGIIEAWFRIVNSNAMFGGSEVKVSLTPFGLKVAEQLRAFKANGGNFARFEYRG